MSNAEHTHGKEDRGQQAMQPGEEMLRSEVMEKAEHLGANLVGGLSHVATDLVHGVGDVGQEVVAVARDTANMAIEGVGSIGSTALHTLGGLVGGVVEMVRDVATHTGAQGREPKVTEHRYEGKPH